MSSTSGDRYLFVTRRRRRARGLISRGLHWAQIVALGLTAVLGILAIVAITLAALSGR